MPPLPATVLSLQCTDPGPRGIDSLSIQRVDLRAHRPDEIVIRVHAVALNSADLSLLHGTFHHRPVVPFAPGVELSGEVLAVGNDVREFKPGDRVAALVGDGALAEAVVVHINRRIVRIPDAMCFTDAAAFGVAYGTAWHALVDRGAARDGESLVVLGASGGVGLAVLDVARMLGLRTMACAASDAKLSVCRRYQPAALVNYAHAPLAQQIDRFTDGRGADIVCDLIGGQHALTAYNALDYNGRHLVVGYSAARDTAIDLRSTLVKGCAVVGVATRLFASHDAAASKRQLAMLASAIALGHLQPHVSQRLPLAEAPLALRSLADRQVVGKILIEVIRQDGV